MDVHKYNSHSGCNNETGKKAVNQKRKRKKGSKKIWERRKKQISKIEKENIINCRQKEQMQNNENILSEKEKAKFTII